MNLRIVQFAAILLTALALVPGGAHLLELLNKLALDQEHYMVVQQIYRGWALTGIVLIGAVLVNVILAILTREQTTAMICAAGAAVLLCVTLAIFFTWTFPVNQATANWSAVPDDWLASRARWEYSHAVNAILTFFALCATIASGLAWVDHPFLTQRTETKTAGNR